MVNVNKILRGIFVMSAFVLLFVLTTVPKSNCFACELGGNKINGYSAYEEFEDACISYKKPWESDNMPIPNFSNFSEKRFIYVNIDDINVSYTEDGKQNITFPESYLE